MGLRSTFVAVAIVTETSSAYHVPISLVNCCHEHQFFKKLDHPFLVYLIWMCSFALWLDDTKHPRSRGQVLLHLKWLVCQSYSEVQGDSPGLTRFVLALAGGLTVHLTNALQNLQLSDLSRSYIPANYMDTSNLHPGRRRLTSPDCSCQPRLHFL